MIRRFRFPTLLALVLTLIALGIVSSGSAVNAAEAGNGSGDIVPGRYIVVLENTASPTAVAADHGVDVRHLYRAALNGFAGAVTPDRLAGLRSDPRVLAVSPDQLDRIVDLPTGIDRIEVDKNPTAAVGDTETVIDRDVAIIDTGINDHDDLTLAGGINFAGGSSTKFSDGYGHGTHVAGTVGARDDGTGVVGVAPGARVWAVRVCNNGGICFRSDIIAGIDWMTERKTEFIDGGSAGINFAAANISLGGAGSADPDKNCRNTRDPYRKAICGAVDAGIVVAVAAGNEEDDAADHVPAAFPEAVTVSAIADYDGKGGGAYSGKDCYGYDPPYYGSDDTLASFSNFGSTIDIAAPGVCILSTSSSGGYALGSGTSMATPHVAGAVALYLEATNSDTPTDKRGANAVINAIKGAGIAQTDLCGFTDDSNDGYAEPLLFVNALAFGGDDSCDTANAEP